MAHEELESVDAFLAWFDTHHPHCPEYRQAVAALAGHVLADVRDSQAMRDARVLQRLTEPDRTVSFRVVWEDDAGEVRMTRGYRVQHCGLLGPYKGGLRFAAGLTPDTLRFLAFEQTFKNALTGLSLGGGKGGAAFDPRGRSEREIERFCRAFMSELYRHIGPDRDVPAGDIGVGTREIGFLFGQYRRLTNRHVGAVTGKDTGYGGSCLRPEATGWGAVYFLGALLERQGGALDDRRIVVSGAGNVATHVADKAIQHGARVLTLSNSDGYLHAPDGLDREQLAAIREARAAGERLADVSERLQLRWKEGARPWEVECDVAMPAATQNEIDGDDAAALVAGGCSILVEAANMPLTQAASRTLREAEVCIAPGKAANAGGVAVSSYEMAQNQLGLRWSAERVDEELRAVMTGIFERVDALSGDAGCKDYERGADRAGFARVAQAMLAMGRH